MINNKIWFHYILFIFMFMLLSILMTIYTLLLEDRITDVLHKVEEKELHNYDYEIDLRPDYIVVYSKHGNIDTIPFGKLEYFFEQDNQ